MSVVTNCMSDESASMGVTETVASLKSCLPAVSTIVPLTDPETLAFAFPELFICAWAKNTESDKQVRINKE